MSATIFVFPGVTRVDQPAAQQPQASVIDTLEKFLDQAMAGRIASIAIAASTADGAPTFAVTYGRNDTASNAALNSATAAVHHIVTSDGVSGASLSDRQEPVA